jgi:hypothetical protein
MGATDVLVLGVRGVLAAALAVAAVAKVRDRRHARAAMASFGVPERLVGMASIAVPATELGAAALLASPAPRPGAALALVLLTGFTVGVAANLAGGRRPDCHCFGNLTTGPIGRRTLVRNLVLLAGATVVLAAGGQDVPAVAVAVPVLVAVAVAVVVVSVSVADRTLRRPRAPGATLVVFVEPGCTDCLQLEPELASWQRAGGPIEVVVHRDRFDVAESFGVVATPGAVLLDQRGEVTGVPVAGPDAVRRLWADATGPAPEAGVPKL